nr:cytochrome P450 2L1-like [Procambarus clarkii]
MIKTFHALCNAFLHYRSQGEYGVHNKLADFSGNTQEEIKRHRASLNPSDIRDYIDAYLVEMEKENNQESTFCEDDLWVAVANLFIGGTETVSATMRWYILYMAQYPEAWYSRLPYTEAVAAEINWLISVSPRALPHLATRDTDLFNYTIPKVTVVCRDDSDRTPGVLPQGPQLMGEARPVLPLHFLDNDGNFISKKESYITFNIGLHQCLGESLARMELFLFQATSMQNFTFSVPKGEKLPFEKDPTIYLQVVVFMKQPVLSSDLNAIKLVY